MVERDEYSLQEYFMKLKREYKQLAEEMGRHPEMIGFFTQLRNLKELIESNTDWMLTFQIERKNGHRD